MIQHSNNKITVCIRDISQIVVSPGWGQSRRCVHTRLWMMCRTSTRVLSAWRLLLLHHRVGSFTSDTISDSDLTHALARLHIAPSRRVLTLVSIRALSRGHVRRQAVNQRVARGHMDPLWPIPIFVALLYMAPQFGIVCRLNCVRLTFRWAYSGNSWRHTCLTASSAFVDFFFRICAL